MSVGISMSWTSSEPAVDVSSVESEGIWSAGFSSASGLWSAVRKEAAAELIFRKRSSILSALSAAEDVFGQTRIYLDVKSPYSYSVDTQLKVICEDDALLEAADSAWAAEGWDIGLIRNNYQ